MTDDDNKYKQLPVDCQLLSILCTFTVTIATHKDKTTLS